MRKNCTSGSVEGVMGDHDLYSDPLPSLALGLVGMTNRGSARQNHYVFNRYGQLGTEDAHQVYGKYLAGVMVG